MPNGLIELENVVYAVTVENFYIQDGGNIMSLLAALFALRRRRHYYATILLRVAQFPSVACTLFCVTESYILLLSCESTHNTHVLCFFCNYAGLLAVISGDTGITNVVNCNSNTFPVSE